MEFLCVIVDAKTNKTLAEYEIEANNEPFSRWKAAKLFRETHPKIELDWHVDSLVID